MRLSELMGKRIVNLYDGNIMGLVGDADLVVNEQDGRIEAILLPCRGGRRRDRETTTLTIPWSAVQKIGAEVIVVEVEDLYGLNTPGPMSMPF